MTKGGRVTVRADPSARLSSLLVPLEEARRRIDVTKFRPWPTRRRELESAVGRYSAETVRAPRDEPSRPLAAMDGFAVRSGARAYRVRDGVIRPGTRTTRLPAGGAIQIATGGPMPSGADAVIRIERARAEGRKVATRRRVRPGEDVHAPGEDFRRGTRLLERGERLIAYHLAPLAALGIGRVRVFEPTITTLVVGDEIERPRRRGVPDSISPALAPLLSFGRVRIVRGVPDRPGRLGSMIARAASTSDLLVSIGGTSVGPHDLTKSEVARVGELLFEGVRVNVLKRGAVGRVAGVPIVCLPGQIGAAWVGWHEHGLHVVGRAVGREPRRWERATLTREVPNRHRMDSIFLFDVAQGRATPRPWGVHNAATFLRSNAFGLVPKGRTLRPGDRVRVQRLEGRGSGSG